MIIFVLLNLLCFILILSKCCWADKSGWRMTTRNMISIFAPYHPQLELIQLKDEDDRDEDKEVDSCDQCDHNRDSDNDSSGEDNPLTDSSISTPSVVNTVAEADVEIQNPENYSSNNNSGSSSGSESDDSVVILDTRVNYFKQAQDIVQELKDELEKKND